MISLKGLDKAEVLAALYNASKPQGRGFLKYAPEPITREEAAVLLEDRTSFDYLQGQVIKVDLSGDGFDPWGYDRDNGQGMAQAAIKQIGDEAALSRMHAFGLSSSIEDVERQIGEETVSEERDGILYVTMGLADVDGTLAEAVEKAKKGSG